MKNHFVYKCSFCPFQETSYNEMSAHFKSKHRQSANEDLTACDSCTNVFGTKKFLAKHYINVHEKLRKMKNTLALFAIFVVLKKID